MDGSPECPSLERTVSERRLRIAGPLRADLGYTGSTTLCWPVIQLKAFIKVDLKPELYRHGRRIPVALRAPSTRRQLGLRYSNDETRN